MNISNFLHIHKLRRKGPYSDNLGIASVPGKAVYLALRIADSLDISLLGNETDRQAELPDLSQLLNSLRKLYKKLIKEIPGNFIPQKIQDLLTDPKSMLQKLRTIDAYLLLEGIFLEVEEVNLAIQSLLKDASFRSCLWDIWLDVFWDYLKPDDQERLCTFIEQNCLRIPGCLAGLLQKLRTLQIRLQKHYESLEDRLMTPKGLEQLLVEYREATDDNATPLGFTSEAYIELIQWLLGQMPCSVLIEPAGEGLETCGTISWYEDSIAKKSVSLTQDKLKHLDPSGSKGYGMFKVPADGLSLFYTIYKKLPSEMQSSIKSKEVPQTITPPAVPNIPPQSSIPDAPNTDTKLELSSKKGERCFVM